MCVTLPSTMILLLITIIYNYWEYSRGFLVLLCIFLVYMHEENSRNKDKIGDICSETLNMCPKSARYSPGNA